MATQQNSDNSIQQVSITLDNLFIELGHRKALNFLKLCIPQLTHTCENLSQHIYNKDWKKAKKLIHRLMGSSHLYASLKLQSQLQSIDAGIITNQNLKQALLEVQTELFLVLNQMKEKMET